MVSWKEGASFVWPHSHDGLPATAESIFNVQPYSPTDGTSKLPMVLPYATLKCEAITAHRLSIPISFRSGLAGFRAPTPHARFVLSSRLQNPQRWISTTPPRKETIDSTASALVPKPTWIDKMPPVTRPYLHLTRIDKPIGTMLLFYPCGEPCRTNSARLSLIFRSMVNHDGVVQSSSRAERPAHLPRLIWLWRFPHEECGMHDQRHVG